MARATVEQCKDFGGHCWVDSGMSLGNGFHSWGEERCKHCPAVRYWESQPSRKYRVVED